MRVNGWMMVSEKEFSHEDGRVMRYTPETPEYFAGWYVTDKDGNVGEVRDTAAELDLPVEFAQLVDAVPEMPVEEPLEPAAGLPPLPTAEPVQEAPAAHLKPPAKPKKAKAEKKPKIAEAEPNPRATAGDNSKHVLDKEVNIAAGMLRRLIERIERLDEERKELASDMRDVMVEASSAGFDKKAIREILRYRRMDPTELEELLTLVDIYSKGLGMSI